MERNVEKESNTIHFMRESIYIKRKGTWSEEVVIYLLPMAASGLFGRTNLLNLTLSGFFICCGEKYFVYFSQKK